MAKILPHEKKLIAELKKRLPEDARFFIHYSRHVSGGVAEWMFGIKPYVGNSICLNVSFYVGNEEAKFEWNGKKLEAGIKALDAWIGTSRRIAATMEKARKLQAQKQLMLPGGEA